MNESGFPTGVLIEKRVVPASKSSFWRSRPSEYPGVGSGNQLLLEARDAGGAVAYSDISSESGKAAKLPGEAAVLLVNRQRVAEIMVFISSAAKDAAGHLWDVIIPAKLSISDGAPLLAAGLSAQIDPVRPLTDEILQLWLPDRVVPFLKDRLGPQTKETLSSLDRRPLKIWESDLGEVLKSLGLQVRSVDAPTWKSFSADQAAAQLKRKEAEEDLNKAREEEAAKTRQAEDLQRVYEEQQRNDRAERRAQEYRDEKTEKERQGDIDQVKAAAELRQAEHRSKLAQIDDSIAKIKQDRSLAEARLQHAIAEEQRLQAEALTRIEIGKQEARERELEELVRQSTKDALAEYERLKVEREQTRVREDIQESQIRIQQRQDDARRQKEKADAMHEEELRLIREAAARTASKKPTEQTAHDPNTTAGKQPPSEPDRLANQILIDSRSFADALAAAQQQGLGANLLAAIRSPDGSLRFKIKPTDIFAARARFEFSASAPKFTIITKGGSVTRASTRSLVGSPRPAGDDGTHPVIQTRVGDPVAFEFRAPISGYVTIINPGTGGHFFLITPNDLAASVHASEDELMHAPGQCVPSGTPNFGQQLGPAGHTEHLIAMITPGPLITTAELRAPDDKKKLRRWDPETNRPMDTFREISPEFMAKIEARLRSFSDGSWAIGCLSYVVSQKWTHG